MKQEKLHKLRIHLNTGLLDRDIPVRLALLALLSGEHLLLIGPPGTAKSELARRLHKLLAHSTYFERLLTRFSVPEELFGPLSLSALEQDRYERQTLGYLPHAEVAFIDEIFKANSAILNALLTLINERLFDNGAKRTPVPLRTVIGASNELPDGEELGALYDRFLLRYPVRYLPPSHFQDLLQLNPTDTPLPLELRLTTDELDQIQEDAKLVTLSDEVLRVLDALRQRTQDQPHPISDRRWRQIVKLLRVSAYTNGRHEVSLWDTWILPYCALHDLTELDALTQWHKSTLAIEAGEHSAIAKILKGTKRSLQEDLDAKLPATDEHGNPLYMINDKLVSGPKKQLHAKNEQGELLYHHPEDRQRKATKDEILQYFSQRNRHYGSHHTEQHTSDTKNRYMITPPQHMEPRTYTSKHISDRRAEVKQLIQDLDDQIQNNKEKLNTFDQSLQHELWLTDDLKAHLRYGYTQSSDQLAKLRTEARSLEPMLKELSARRTKR